MSARIATVDAAGVPAHPDYPRDGMSLLENLRCPDRIAPRELFWRMKFRDQKAARAGAWKWLSIEGYEYLFDLSQDQRERANLSRRHPERLAELKKRYLVWEAGLPPIPEDARVSLLCGPAEMPQPVHAEL